jgi:hypothetical protein
VDKVERPAIIWIESLGFNRSASQGELASNPFADLQIRRAIDPRYAFVVVEDPLSSEKDRQPWQPVTAMLRRERYEP